MKNDELYEMKLGDILHDFGDNRTLVLRVPGGWVFTYHFSSIATSVFIPFDNEFQKVTNPNA